MHDLLTVEERTTARAKGWDLYYLYDVAKARWLLAPLPIEFTPTRSAQQVMNEVVAEAQFRNPLCLKVLQLMAQFAANPRKQNARKASTR